MAKKAIRYLKESQKEFQKVFSTLCDRHSDWKVWSDFIELAAISISNGVDRQGKDHDDRQRLYGQIAKQYTEKEMAVMPKLFNMVVTALENEPGQDFLGEMFMALELGNHCNWYFDICAMIKMLTQKGRPAREVIVSNDVGEFLMADPWMIAMLDNRRIEMGRIAPEALTEFVTSLGVINFMGRKLELLVSDGTYEDDEGKDQPLMEAESVIVTAPGCGKGLYGGVTQLEADGEFHTYAGMRVPQHIFTMKPPVKETQLTAKPLFAPVRKNPWTSATKVLSGQGG